MRCVEGHKIYFHFIASKTMDTCIELTCHDTHKNEKFTKEQQLTIWIDNYLSQMELIVGYLAKPMKIEYDRMNERMKQKKKKTNANDNLRINHLYHIEYTYLQMKHINFQMIELAIFLLLIVQDKYLLGIFFSSIMTFTMIKMISSKKILSKYKSN